MKNRGLFLLIFTSLALSIPSTSLALNGRAVTVITNLIGPRTLQSNPASLVVITLSGKDVVKTDSILRGGPFLYPAWSFDGKRIVFYKNGTSAALCSLWVIDADGKNLRALTATGSTWTVGWDNSENLAWPGADGGKWIYYVRPCSACFINGTGEVWKINVDDPTQKSLVCDYTKLDTLYNPSGVSGIVPCEMWRWALSADAKYSVAHTNGTSPSQMAYQPGIICHTFPPTLIAGTMLANPRLTAPTCTDGNGCANGDCNSALSASGNIMFHFSGGHDALYACYWNHTAKTLNSRYNIGTGNYGQFTMGTDAKAAAKAGTFLGKGWVWPRGSCNSDKVFTILAEYQYSAQYGNPACGDNLLVINWKDKDAAQCTFIPEPQHPKGYVIDGTPFQYANPSDYHVDGGPAGCCEDTLGNWVQVPGAITAVEQRTIAPKLPAYLATNARSALYDLRGACIGSFDVQSFARHAAGSFPQGPCIISCQGMTQKALMIGNGIVLR